MQISILGCGWLGFPLAISLLKKGFVINGSTTSDEKLKTLEDSGINSFLISLNEKKIDGDFDVFLENSELLIINIPPKLRGNQTENFVLKIENVLPFIEKLTIKKVIFVSSTSVYAEDNSIVTETTICKPETESGRQLLEVETLLLSNFNFETTILRFGGLIGKDRNPTRMLAGKNNISNPDVPINLIHQDDCIGMIHKIIETNSFNEIYNAVTPFHPSRKDYYTQKAIELGLEIPGFNFSKPSIGKTVSSEKLIQNLNYNFLKPEL